MSRSIIKSVFCPNDEYLLTTTTSIKNLVYYIQNNASKFDIRDIFVVGWVNEVKLIAMIKKFMSNLVNMFEHLTDINIKFMVNTTNYGKLYYFKCLHDCNLGGTIYYFDHDIILDYAIDIFTDVDKLLFNKNIGVVAYNQSCDSRHQLCVYELCSKFSGVEYFNPINFDNSKGSIALGAFAVTGHIFNLLRNIDHRFVYGMDENIISSIMLDHKKIIVVVKNIYVIHPFDANMKYKLWKLNTTISNAIHGNQINYYHMIEQSHNFWNGMCDD